MESDAKAAEGGLERYDGVAVGMLMAMDGVTARVVFAGNKREEGVPARCLVPLSATDIGAQVALGFENGDPERPIVLGKIISDAMPMLRQTEPLMVEVDNQDPLEIAADRELILRCGKASITLTRAGKIILRGTYISSRSSGVNRVKGGSVQLN